MEECCLQIIKQQQEFKKLHKSAMLALEKIQFKVPLLRKDQDQNVIILQGCVIFGAFEQSLDRKIH